MPILTNWVTWGMFALGLLIGVGVCSWLTDRRAWRKQQEQAMDELYGAFRDRREDG